MNSLFGIAILDPIWHKLRLLFPVISLTQIPKRKDVTSKAQMQPIDAVNLTKMLNFMNKRTEAVVMPNCLLSSKSLLN